MFNKYSILEIQKAVFDKKISPLEIANECIKLYKWLEEIIK